MATTWLPKNRSRATRSYLLTNGEVVQEPDLEETSTGLKIRVAGTSESHFKRTEPQVIEAGLHRIAKRQGARFWMPVDLNESALNAALGFTPAEIPAKFEPTSVGYTKALAWWSFQHPTLPIKAVLAVRWQQTGSAEQGHRIYVRLVVPDQEVDLTPSAISVSDESFSEVNGGATFAKWVEDHPSSWSEDAFVGQFGVRERDAINALLRKVRLFDSLDEIEIPDLRDVDNPAWLTLKFHESNINGQFINDITEYLDGDVGIEKVLAAYVNLANEFRKIGIVVGTARPLNAKRLTHALLNGDDEALTMTIGAPVDDEGVRDRSHEIGVHLPTGTFVVSCDRSSNQDQVAHAWEESLVVARLSGKEDVLLAYAEEYARTQTARITKNLVGQRKSALANH